MLPLVDARVEPPRASLEFHQFFRELHLMLLLQIRIAGSRRSWRELLQGVTGSATTARRNRFRRLSSPGDLAARKDHVQNRRVAASKKTLPILCTRVLYRLQPRQPRSPN